MVTLINDYWCPFYYSNKYKNSTTKMISRKFYLITKNKEMIEKLILNAEKIEKLYPRNW